MTAAVLCQNRDILGMEDRKCYVAMGDYFENGLLYD